MDEVKKLLPLARYNAQKGQKQNIGQALTSSFNGLVSSAKSFLGIEEQSVKPKLFSIPMEFRVITPFNEIGNLNLVRLDYGFKQENGRNMLLMYLTFQEIIEKSGVTKKVAKNPTNYGKENIGRLSPQPTGNILNLSPALNIPSGL